jgi:hypothetical protein
MDQSQRWRNLFANVSHIHIKPSVSEDTIKSLAIAAKSVENKQPALYNFQEVGMKFMQSNS